VSVPVSVSVCAALSNIQCVDYIRRPDVGEIAGTHLRLFSVEICRVSSHG